MNNNLVRVNHSLIGMPLEGPDVFECCMFTVLRMNVYEIVQCIFISFHVILCEHVLCL